MESETEKISVKAEKRGEKTLEGRSSLGEKKCGGRARISFSRKKTQTIN